MIVAHFYDVESGRTELEERGHGHAHERFNIPIPRDGGLAALLEQAERTDRPFVAVICESIERVARRTYFGTKVEYLLERAGVALWAADEPISVSGTAKKATPTLTRRVKQAVSEWYVLQMLELSWDGFREHTQQGWNIGKPPYGYLPDKVPHPVAARRAEGRTKHRLTPDPLRAPVVTAVYQWRALEGLGYDTIAARLNTDPGAYPVPEPTRPHDAVGRWTGSSVREILNNPKYTGYMVWNRRASKDKKHPGKNNPRSAWIWSPMPVHEPLVTRELFDAVTPVARARQGSRQGAGANTAHGQTKRSYALRSYVLCDYCGRRMFGKTRRGHAYMACQIDAHQHRDEPWFAAHPPSVYVREDRLLAAVHEFFTQRVFHPYRRDHLDADLRAQPTDSASPRGLDERENRIRELEKSINDLQRRQDRLIRELEATLDDDADDDPTMRHEFRKGIQRRFADLGKQRQTLETEQRKLQEPPAARGSQDADLIDALPILTGRLDTAPEDLQRALFDAYGLRVRYNRARDAATITVTVTGPALPALQQSARAIDDATGGPTGPPVASDTANGVAHVLCAPGRIRTCAFASGGRSPV